MRWVQDTYKGYEVESGYVTPTRGTRRNKTPTMCTRQVRDPYDGYKAGTRPLQGVQGRYVTPTRGTRYETPYKEYEVGTCYIMEK